MNLLKLYEASTRYGHTLWIDPNGKIIDISKNRLTHFEWLNDKYKPKNGNEIFSIAAKKGWTQVRNHQSMTSLGGSVSFMGNEKYIRKHKDVIFDIIDQSLFDPKVDRFFVDITFVDDKGDPVGERQTFGMPKADSKLRRFL